MSTHEILAELPRLSAHEREQVLQRLCELQENDLLDGVHSAEAEKKLLDEALADYQRNGDRGAPWPEVLSRIGSMKKR